MNKRKHLFLAKDPFEKPKDDSLFLSCMMENLHFQLESCEDYRRICDHFGFSPDQIKSEADLSLIPPITTSFLKQRRLFSMPTDQLAVKATSSGTSGEKSIVGFDHRSLFLGIAMMVRYFAYTKVLSPIPVHYIVLGYEPSKENEMGAAKTAYGTTFFAPALSRDYALIRKNGRYEANIEGIGKRLFKAAKGIFPVRFVGFPPYMYFLCQYLEENHIQLKLPRGSKILLGGGWKQFSGQEIDRETLFAMTERCLGLKKEDYLEFFSAVEHPLPYVKCKNGHFHIPRFSRVIIRDPQTWQSLPYYELGIINFLTPLVMSMPLLSIMTDDIGMLCPGESCGCGIDSDYFILAGRAGIHNIKTCAAEAAELMQH